MTSIISFHTKHDANITVAQNNKPKQIFECERFFQQKYFGFSEEPRAFREELKSALLKIYQLIGGLMSFDYCIFNWQTEQQKEVIKEIIDSKNFLETTHHRAHAAGVYFLSPFEHCLIFSMDGGGDDGWFNIYEGKNNKVRLLKKLDLNLGTPYRLVGNFISEIKSKKQLAFGRGLDIAGKLMGLAGYGDYNEKIYNAVRELMFEFKQLNDLQKFAQKINIPFDIDCLDKQKGRDLAYNTQKAIEDIIEEVFIEHKDLINTKNICLTGGCALNVLSNSRLAHNFSDYNFFVPSNQSDCGISLGSICDLFPDFILEECAWSGMPLLDIADLDYFKSKFSHYEVGLGDLAKYLYSRKIIGFIQGNAEHGPRALGNRSILASPSYPNIKDIINKKIKFRESYRPFAPMVLEEEVDKYFILPASSPYMSFSAIVRENYREMLHGITHVDGSSRVQTVSFLKTPLMYKLLKEFERVSGFPVLLNTSLNIKGKPLIARLGEAFEILSSTKLDYLYFDRNLFKY